MRLRRRRGRVPDRVCRPLHAQLVGEERRSRAAKRVPSDFHALEVCAPEYPRNVRLTLYGVSAVPTRE